jgi:hypothetical protein
VNFKILKKIAQAHVKNILNKQENVLKKRTKCEKKTSNISIYLAFKTQKPEDKLLMNRTEGFRLKNQIRSTFEDKGLKQKNIVFKMIG